MSDWISVDERMPDYYPDESGVMTRPVLTCDDHGNMHIMQHHYLSEYPFGVSPDDRKFYPVKYWMPLPEPPIKKAPDE